MGSRSLSIFDKPGAAQQCIATKRARSNGAMQQTISPCIYRTSPLSSGVTLGNLQPGDRMPDARLNDGSRLR
jgi:hypothetical protein